MIDRSNPLPIHQLPCLIDEVARLKAHCAQEPGCFATLEKLLAVLGGFRAGDAEIFETLIDYLESNHGGTEYEDVELSAMRRYRDMARKMEENR